MSPLSSCCCKWLGIAVVVVSLLPAVIYKIDSKPLVPGHGVDIPESLEGYNVLVTGSSQGIGLFTAAQFYDRGATVIVTGRRAKKNVGAAKRIAGISASKRHGAKTLPMPLDLGNFSDVRRFARAVGNRVKRLDIVILNAAISYTSKLNDPKNTTSVSGHDLAYATCQLGHFLLMRLLQPNLAPGAKVIVLGSGYVWGTSGIPDMTPKSRIRYELPKRQAVRHRAYSIAKQANWCFTKALRRHLDGKALVSMFNPGVVGTPALRDSLKTCSKRYVLDWCGPKEDAGRMAFESAFVTEQPLPGNMLYGYWLPKFIYSHLVSKAVRKDLLGRKWSVWWYLPEYIQRLLRWGVLHEVVGPECDMETQEAVWRYSAKQTGVKP